MTVDPARARQQGPGNRWPGMLSYSGKLGRRGDHLGESEKRSDVSGLGETHQKRGNKDWDTGSRYDSQECEV